MVHKRGTSSAVHWGCVCKGNVAKGGVELRCHGCALTFHAKCERLDYSVAELKAMVAQDSFVCAACELIERREAGFDPSQGRFVWQCRTCTRTFEESERRAAEKHGERCERELASRKWACRCEGRLASAKLIATQCTECSMWFHAACKAQERNWWDKTLRRDRCVACERSADKLQRATANGIGGTALTVDQPPAERPASVTAYSVSELDPLPDEKGTLADQRVVVKPSGLGPASGLGLFAGCAIGHGQVVTSYYGTLVYREQLGPETDTSYIVRVPNSGGALVDGKPFADAIRANPANPNPARDREGVHTPLPGAPEWSLGAGAMANDPRDRQLTNAKLDFVKPKEGPQAVRDLAIMRPVLVATRDIAAGEEIFWSYGSATPFEHLRKQQLELQSRKRRREICRFTWVPHE